MDLQDYYRLPIQEQAQIRPTLTCRETRVLHSHRVRANELNNNKTLFGGILMQKLDNITAISAIKLSRLNGVTASTDSVDFINPIKPDHAITFESFVTGVGSSSCEVFCKVICENLMTGDRYLGATAFLTFAFFGPERNKILLPLIKPETEEERFICCGYEERRDRRLAKRKQNIGINANLNIDPGRFEHK